MTHGKRIIVPKSMSTRRCDPKVETKNTFKQKLIWLADSAMNREEVFIGAAISVKTNNRQIDGLPEVLILVHASRLLMVPLDDKKTIAWLEPLLGGHVFVDEKRVLVSMLEGAMSTLLIHGKTGLQLKVVELSKGTSLGEGKKTWEHINLILGESNNKSLRNIKYSSFDGTRHNALSNFWERSAQRALASYLIASSTSPSSNSIINTSLRSKRELNFLSQSAAASYALFLLAPKHAKGDVCAPKLLRDGSVELINNRFNTRIRPNSEQIIHFKPAEDTDGREMTFRASKIRGKKSTLKGSGNLANLNNWKGEWVVKGKEDKSLAEEKALEWMGNSIRIDPVNGGSKAEFDKSGLLNLLLFNEPFVSASSLSSFKSRTRAFDSLASATLNNSQRDAAEKILSSDSRRLVLIQGPPGSGKSNLIGQVAKQWKEWNLGKESIYAV